MKSYKNPICMAEDEESWRGVCGVPMKLVDERHPLYQPKAWTFTCPKCGAYRMIDEKNVDRCAEAR